MASWCLLSALLTALLFHVVNGETVDFGSFFSVFRWLVRCSGDHSNDEPLPSQDLLDLLLATNCITPFESAGDCGSGIPGILNNDICCAEECGLCGGTYVRTWIDVQHTTSVACINFMLCLITEHIFLPSVLQGTYTSSTTSTYSSRNFSGRSECSVCSCLCCTHSRKRDPHRKEC